MSVTTQADLNALLKGIYSQPLILADDDYIFEGEMAKKYGSRVDDTAEPGPPPEVITSRRLPPNTVLITNNEIIQRAMLGGDQERQTAEQLILQRRRQREMIDRQRAEQREQDRIRAEYEREQMRRDLRERFPSMRAAEMENTINLEMERQRVLRENTQPSPEAFVQFMERKVAETKEKVDRQFRQQLMGTFDVEDDYMATRSVIVPGPPPGGQGVGRSKPKAQTEVQQVRGKRRISFEDT